MKNQLTDQDIHTFQTIIYRYYHTHGRDLPWRQTFDPYKILVSEIMLQQTQVHRVLKKYEKFIHAFPDFHALAKARFTEILPLWQGLGYNRRALALQRIAQEICAHHNGILPGKKSILLSLPSIGKATAGSLLAFAYHQPEVIIETNIRVVYMYFFFPDHDQVKDTELYPYVESTMDQSDPRNWYYGLMDYGVFLKKKYPGITTKSAHYKKQSPFIGSDRQIRGMILKILADKKVISEKALLLRIGKENKRILKILAILIKEGFIQQQKKSYRLKK